VQEALNNAHVHGLAQTSWVFLQREGTTVEILIRDDGNGIERGRSMHTNTLVAGGHYGLVGMRERASAVGGTLSISSGPGGFGTEVRFRIPRLRPQPSATLVP
jgi:signal transduction histidine kinase